MMLLYVLLIFSIPIPVIPYVLFCLGRGLVDDIKKAVSK